MQNQKTHAKSGTLQIRRKNNGNGLQKKLGALQKHLADRSKKKQDWSF